MEIIYLLLPIGLLMSAVAVAWFVWSVRSGQMDDLDTPAWRILFDDERIGKSDSNVKLGKEKVITDVKK